MAALELTSTQRRYLKSQVHHLKPLLQMGKDGPSAQFLAQLKEQLVAHELLKVRALNNCTAGDAEIRAAVEGEGVTVVQKVGHVYTFFLQNPQDSLVELPPR